MAAASVFVMDLSYKIYVENTTPEISHSNVGYGIDVSILELARLIKLVIGYEGRMIFDSSKPDGAPRKLMNSTKLLNLGWNPTINLEDGLRISYEMFKIQ